MTTTGTVHRYAVLTTAPIARAESATIAAHSLDGCYDGHPTPQKWFTLYMATDGGERYYLLSYTSESAIEKIVSALPRQRWTRATKHERGYIGMQGHASIDDALADGQRFVRYHSEATR